MDLLRKLASEAIGTMLLLAVVIGSGMGGGVLADAAFGNQTLAAARHVGAPKLSALNALLPALDSAAGAVIATLIVLFIAGRLALGFYPEQLTRAAFTPSAAFEQQAAKPSTAYADPALWLARPDLIPPGTRTRATLPSIDSRIPSRRAIMARS